MANIVWTGELRAEVIELWKTHSGAEIAAMMRARGFVCTRCSVLGLIGRMRMTEKDKEVTRNRRSTDPSQILTRKEALRRLSERRRAERWAANPDLKARYERQQEVRAMMLASGTSKTSVAFRKHMPRLADMTKNELRAMLSAAVQNTAAMAVPA